jgi:hypothetical protein
MIGEVADSNWRTVFPAGHQLDCVVYLKVFENYFFLVD